MLSILLVPALNDNYIYLLHEPNSGKTAVVDPAVSAPVLDALQQQDWQLDYIFNTHHHGDHVGANLQLKQQTGCQIVGSAADQARIPGIDISVGNGDVVKLGNLAFQVIDTPGHTLGHIVYYSAESQALFCGDTLFSLGCGRLFEGSAEQMWQSLQKLKTLPAETRVYCAHEYTAANGRFALSVDADNLQLRQRIAEVYELRQQNLPTLPSTIDQELATNPFFRAHDASIRANIGMTEQTDVAVFSQLRLLKDQFQ
ncbi:MULTISPECIES: hydroxyacylglutathione hydrolase [Methylomonas]|uniref:Hydroxyacylglutathione hydrolase n=2 Tax=Methylomonas TaxID=416 RepID=A0A126T6Z6_9GAMM|nr:MULTISPECIES: hydroxyacylglutathione hydrolase [Methylomonas]AMK77851.1 hydroxyacylglutathione hydrolase [Methylomonas denitrificans]OAI00926.1 hydroxyacylglutathione hydrolase [Methylomonas methanica]TCV87022.1 hydroxyacylglutathione hydrolase [Methylomonas methanica]